MKYKTKQALRRFILEKLKEISRVELGYLAADYDDCFTFEMVSQFELEIKRIEKLFNFPLESSDLSGEAQ
jgi:hypothetical protein